MKYIFKVIIIIFILQKQVLSRDVGETEITTDEGIEVYQIEKYYLLKKNVRIDSDKFTLLGDKVKIFFDKDLYDIKTIDAVGNVVLTSEEYNIKASGQNLIFKIQNQTINIKGMNSKLLTNDSDMYSDGEINVDNNLGNFYIFGSNSSLKSQNIFIEGQNIDGVFSQNEEIKEISYLNVLDEKISYIRTNNTEMYANKIKYSKKNSLIELENNVRILRDGEIITGDYGTLDTKNDSYKIKSKKSNKVKVIISNQDE